MTSPRNTHYIEKKAFEISYALFRLAATGPRSAFSEHLEHYAVTILSAISENDLVRGESLLRGLANLVRLGEGVGLLGGHNSFLLSIEISNLNAAIRQLPHLPHEYDADLTGAFTARPREEAKKAQPSSMEDVISSPALKKDASEEDMAVTDERVILRQSAIYEIIRQSGNLGFAELQDSFPDVSERTLRYDLQRLIESGLIERIGTGGPSTHYKVRGPARAKEANVSNALTDGSA